MTLIARRIRVSGIVQGVGFRPFVWRLAQELQLSGWVRNDARGVEIFAQGSAVQMAALLERLRSDAPALARVDQVHSEDAATTGTCGFSIVASVKGRLATAIGPDVAVCPDCLAELFDPTDRRWRHGFITCTHCGPRYTVTRTLPYDRPQTSLAPFPLCPDCEREYTTAADRRFHAETTCCPACGPQLSLRDAQGHHFEGDPIAVTLDLLRGGAIVAIKGLGGFHLACDARNAEAVARLRLRKNREEKPFAVMSANVESLAPYARISTAERGLLESRERPVVLLRTPTSCDAVLPGVAPGLLELGVMLPTTPIHFLLFHEAAGRPVGTIWLTAPQELVLVMTSANPGGEPIVRDGVEARIRLAGIADALLDHDRDIAARCDDSVLRPLGAGAQFIRRSRGYAPSAIRLPQAGPSVLAFGAHLKNCVCVSRDDQAFASPHIGDLDNAATCSFLDETVERMLTLLEVKPALVAHDLHPDDYSTRAAIAFAEQHGLPTLAVQHHHAHIAAVCAEHGRRGPVLGLALDGVGLGSDGTAWGGELLRVDGARFERLGHLRPLPLPGGDKAAREPWRMAAAVLHELGRNAQIEGRFQETGAGIVAGMLARGFNCPRSSSMGRVFDAAAGLLGLCSHMKYEALAAIFLEQAATRHMERHGWPAPMAGGWNVNPDGQLDLRALLAALDGAPDVDLAAARFHATLVAALADWVMRTARASDLTILAWGGGCFLNSLLSSGLRQNLEQQGLQVLAPRRLSPGDASIAVGQAWVAINSLEQ
ncbi:MAG: carbamoyltransferase HypF [Rhodoferax sp.]|uniref:carbamoyltransferase HypF n=1 Tax=Rhodoferax sp. TaxID=50421 RepID=UPI002602676A|nr:carbamoyltransferase HypF [Rhodoferax sp.]MDD5336317.1 carbamoyltransferase HypF [Rhodoferax sp.]